MAFKDDIADIASKLKRYRDTTGTSVAFHMALSHNKERYTVAVATIEDKPFIFTSLADVIVWTDDFLDRNGDPERMVKQATRLHIANQLATLQARKDALDDDLGDTE